MLRHARHRAYLLLLAAGACAGATTVQDPAAQTAIEREQRAQLQLALETNQARNERLQGLAYPLLAASTVYCGEAVRPDIGVAYATRWSFPEEAREVARDLYGVGDRFVLLAVTPGAPAASAGLEPGDVLVSLDGEPVPDVPSGDDVEYAREDLESAWERALRDGAVTVGVERRGAPLSIPVEAVEICDYPVSLVASNEVNAYADGSTVFVTTGMLRFVETDLELQTVLSHELAHNIEGHSGSTRTNVLLGALLGALVDAVAGTKEDAEETYAGRGAELGAQAFSQDLEREADYMGLYLLENAGIRTEDAANLWRRMALEHQDSILYGASHPTTAERFLNLQNTTAEIRAKQAAGEPLVPTRRRE